MPVGASATGESIVRLEDTSRSARRSSNAKSGMEGNRSDGFFAIARRNSSSTGSGTSGRLSGGYRLGENDAPQLRTGPWAIPVFER